MSVPLRGRVREQMLIIRSTLHIIAYSTMLVQIAKDYAGIADELINAGWSANITQISRPRNGSVAIF